MRSIAGGGFACRAPGYERIAAVEVPDANLLGVYTPRTAGAEEEEEAVLARGRGRRT